MSNPTITFAPNPPRGGKTLLAATFPRVPPYAGLLNRMSRANAPRPGDCPSNVDPRVAAWFWAYYLRADAGFSDEGARRQAARFVCRAQRGALASAPVVDKNGALVDVPPSAVSVRCDEIDRLFGRA